jgi:hypothetical protein
MRLQLLDAVGGFSPDRSIKAKPGGALALHLYSDLSGPCVGFFLGGKRLANALAVDHTGYLPAALAAAIRRL